MSVDRPTKFNDKQQSHLNKIEESKSENSQESMISSKSDDLENIKIINIDSDESEQSNYSQNSQEEAKDVSANSDDSESPKLNAKVTQKEIRNIILSNFTSNVSEKELLEKDIRLSSSTVYRQYAQLRSEKGTNNRKKGTGMKKEVNQDIISLLKKQLKKDNSQTIAEITKNMKAEGIKISRETVRKNIKKLGYESKVPIEGHILTVEQKEKRLNWCKKFKNKTDWDNVYFTDEKVFKCGSIRKRRWLMKDEKNITSLRKYAKKVNAWGAIKKGVKISLKLFTQNMDKEYYVGILKEKLSELKKHGDNDWQLQFDNDPKHKSKLAIDFFKNKKIDFIDWPPYSPDLNPIENVWSMIAQELNGKNIQTQAGLFEEIEKAWEKLDQNKIDNAIDSIPGRIMD